MSTTPAWKQHSGGRAWPTVALAAAVLVGAVSVHLAWGQGLLALPVAVPLMVALQYLAFTPLHEAVHGNVSGQKSGQGTLDRIVGWPMAALLMAPYPAFVAIHLWHHARTNDPDEDPDHWVAGPAWQVPLRCLTILPRYEWQFFTRPSKPMKAQLPAAAAGLAVLLALAVAAGLGFGWTPVLVLWLLPGVLATGLLAFAFDWLPHHPHDARGRYVDTRVIEGGRLLHWLLLGQDKHAVHHLWPRVPFYRYDAVWRAEAAGMVERGTPVLSVGATGPSARRPGLRSSGSEGPDPSREPAG